MTNYTKILVNGVEYLPLGSIPKVEKQHGQPIMAQRELRKRIRDRRNEVLKSGEQNTKGRKFLHFPIPKVA